MYPCIRCGKPLPVGKKRFHDECRTQTLVDIVEGVAEASREKDGGESRKSIAPDAAGITKIEFDLSVSVEKSGENKAGFGILVAPFSGGIGRKDAKGDVSSSRIKFDVLMDLARAKP